MTVQELIDLLFKTGNLNADVTATDIYGEVTFEITSLVLNNDGVELTGETYD